MLKNIFDASLQMNALFTPVSATYCNDLFIVLFLFLFFLVTLDNWVIAATLAAADVMDKPVDL